MKVYSIGRDTECDIVINDSSDVISRRHAVISVANNGKLTITDTSFNGTYVNGIRISPNVPVPVTRKDSVTFAHVAKLDWKLIPKPVLMRWLLPGGVATGIVVVASVVCAVCFSGGKSSHAGKEEKSEFVADSVNQEKADSTVKEKQDSTQTKKTPSRNKKAASCGKKEAAKDKRTQSSSDKKSASKKKQETKSAETKAKKVKTATDNASRAKDGKTQPSTSNASAKSSEQNNSNTASTKKTRIR